MKMSVNHSQVFIYPVLWVNMGSVQCSPHASAPPWHQSTPQSDMGVGQAEGPLRCCVHSSALSRSWAG